MAHRRDILDELTPDKAKTYRQAVGTALYLSIDRPTMQFAMGEVMSGMQTPLVKHDVALHKVARYVLQYPVET